MTIAEVLSYIEPALVEDTKELLQMIISAPDSAAAVQRAKLAVASDAADEATDLALDAALKAGK